MSQGGMADAYQKYVEPLSGVGLCGSLTLYESLNHKFYRKIIYYQGVIKQIRSGVFSPEISPSLRGIFHQTGCLRYVSYGNAAHGSRTYINYAWPIVFLFSPVARVKPGQKS